jgi:hypothetical protein
MNFIMMPIPEDKFTAVCALLGGVSDVAVTASASKATAVQAIEEAYQVNLKDEPAEIIEERIEAAGDPEFDADGIAFDPNLHTGTKTKAGLWRMKKGVERPEVTGTSNSGTASQAGASAPEPDADEDDEFAAFRKAAAKSDAEDVQAAAEVPARKWTDADLGALCNQAATKLGDPLPIKALIAEFIPEGEVAHSRNIPQDQRADFAAAVEAKAGIEFAG